jgi:hypothetical protein
MKTVALAAIPLVVCLGAVGCEYSKSNNAALLAPTPVPPVSTRPVAHPGYPTTGPQLVAHAIRTYPEYLRPTRNYEQRSHNMSFLRDRMIEMGICGGMDLARNLKRGKGPHSMDAIAWRPDGVRVEVVDIAHDWSNYRRRLSLHWVIVSGPAGYEPIGRPDCE